MAENESLQAEPSTEPQAGESTEPQGTEDKDWQAEYEKLLAQSICTIERRAVFF